MAECGYLCLGFGRGRVAGIDCHCTFPQFVARNPRGPDAILQGEPVVAGRICAHVEAYAVTLLERSTAIRIDLGSAGDGFENVNSMRSFSVLGIWSSSMRWHEAIKSAAAANVAIRLILVVIPCNFILCQSIGFKLFQSL